VLLTNHHTPLISHTADDIITTLTGTYGDRHGPGGQWLRLLPCQRYRGIFKLVRLLDRHRCRRQVADDRPATPQRDTFTHLASAYKAINAPLGELGRKTLELSTTALVSDDATYATLEEQLRRQTRSSGAHGSGSEPVPAGRRARCPRAAQMAVALGFTRVTLDRASPQIEAPEPRVSADTWGRVSRPAVSTYHPSLSRGSSVGARGRLVSAVR
jgi:hypothetical protein